jgi:hypothetical protein
MNMKKLTLVILVVALMVSAPVLAQDAQSAPPDQQPAVAAAQAATPPTPAAAKADIGDMRHHIYVMEGALSRAVDYGAKNLAKEMRTVMPDVFMLAGEAQARGVYLDGYGVFFDVEVPMLRQSMIWSLRMMMDQGDTQTQTAIANLRKGLTDVSDPEQRASMERAIRVLERQAVPGSGMQPRSGGPRDPAVAPGVVMPRSVNELAPAPAAPAAEKTWVADPNSAYTEAVQKALVDAMIDYSAPMRLGPEEWLTVAARDNERRDSLAPQDPFEETVTMIYRIMGSDLMLYRSGKIDRDEVRRRVKVGEF